MANLEGGEARDRFMAQVAAEDAQLNEANPGFAEMLSGDPDFRANITHYAIERVGERQDPELLGREKFGYRIAKRVQRWASYRIATMEDLEHSLSEEEFNRKMFAQDSFTDTIGANPETEADPYFYLAYSYAYPALIRRQAGGERYPDVDMVETSAGLRVLVEAADIVLDDPLTEVTDEGFTTKVRTATVADIDALTTITIRLRDLGTTQHYTIIEEVYDLDPSDDPAEPGGAIGMDITGTNTYHLTRKSDQVIGIFWPGKNDTAESLQGLGRLLGLAKGICPDADALIANARKFPD